ncbi:MAG TPA: M2 family metallopeptidase [Steroidobacteraceae bacterium]|nr:M2 family metallopeptidase [Steroidobacteraceae bacterium]
MRYQFAKWTTAFFIFNALVCFNANAAPPTAKDADEFVAKVNRELVAKGLYWQTADWVAANYITEDTQRLAAMANDDALAYTTRIIKEARRFDHVKGLSASTARALNLIKLGNTLLAPASDAQRAELARLTTKMESDYSAAKWCHQDAQGNQRCSSLQDIEDILRNDGFTHTPQELADAWTGWHDAARPMRKDYEQFVALANAGSRNFGFADTGELWRSGYDMSAAQFSNEVERLWHQVEPLYTQLHCYVRARLNEKYGDAVVSKTGPIPADLLGDMWAQDWSNVYPLVEPYPGLQSGSVTNRLKAMRDTDYQQLRQAFKGTPSVSDDADMQHAADKAIAVKMTHIAEDFYTSLGMPALPDSFWKNSTLVKPRDRDMVCHASAWDFDLSHNDLRLKQCIEDTEEDLFTVHHELGHIYYFMNYEPQPPLFQRGAHDGFHEAIGDTITLSLTPQHLVKIGLLDSASDDPRMLINAQMKKALDKIAFLPFGKLVDQWRWQVFSGQTKPDRYNADWWQLREKYQGVMPPAPRDESDFDPGAKYHIASNTPYTRYFLSFIIQFQFQKALCDAAGYKGELARCDIYGNKAAGEKFMAMLRAGASQPWQDTLQQLTGSRRMDASAIIEYFQPLMNYLREQNKNRQCGW